MLQLLLSLVSVSELSFPTPLIQYFEIYALKCQLLSGSQTRFPFSLFSGKMGKFASVHVSKFAPVRVDLNENL